MKLKLLLFSLLFASGAAIAQDTIPNLVISEARIADAWNAYVEFTNMEDTALNLSSFEFGHIGAWTIPWNAETNQHIMLPDFVLGPGESFVIASTRDFQETLHARNPEQQERWTKEKMWELADMWMDFPEANGDETDSVSTNYQILEVWNGRDCWYIEYHEPDGDSMVIDQVNGWFDEQNPDDSTDITNYDQAYDIAGFTDASSRALLVRKFSVKEGSDVFVGGDDLADSEWMPVPFLRGAQEPQRAVFWTVGNHVGLDLDETTLTSATLDVNWTDSTIVVPWGIRNDDSLITQFAFQPGIAWHYDYSENHNDSGFVSVRTGDVLTVYACGNDLDVAVFDLIAAAPTADAALVIPKRTKNDDGYYGANAGALFKVSHNMAGGDMIYEVPFGLHVDTLLKYLEKAPDANWEMIWSGGTERTAVISGDILRVTAEDGTTTKDYTIDVEAYRSGHNPYLASITWPDIPVAFKGLYGWNGDTIPNFVNTNLEYKVTIPYVAQGIPALVPKTEDINAYFEVDRATNLFGSVASKTVTITSYAEDDTTIAVYKIQLEKQKHPDDVQPWAGEPFISQFIFQERWANGLVEIVNPGNQPLDLSRYMFSYVYSSDPQAGITNDTQPDSWGDRWNKYIPGYKWVDEATWTVTPGLVEPDDAINKIIQPGDVFVMASIDSGWDGDGWSDPESDGKHIVREQIDLDFRHNPWSEDIKHWGNAAHQWISATFFMYEILNDTILWGEKGVGDPADFRLIDVMGSSDGSDSYTINGETIGQIQGFIRKPDIYVGTPSFAESFGTDHETSQWLKRDRPYYTALNQPWPLDIYLVCDGIGSHFMNDVTVYRSTIASEVYKVSQGYSMEEQIRGVVDNTTAEDFLANILKVDEGQTLTLKASADGAVLTGTDVVLNGDSLIVVSADMTNTSAYILEVTAAGLSDDAVLTSTTLTIDVTGSTGTVSGFALGSTLKSVRNAVNVPTGAQLVIIDENDAYLPLTKLNIDTVLVDVLASSKAFFEVTAEDGQTVITYQLMPDHASTDAFVYSSVFEIDQDAALIDLIPRGTTVAGLYANLVASPGATFVLLDKLDHERVLGDVVRDDRLIVTAEDGTTQKAYYMGMQEAVGYLAFVLSDVYLVDQFNFEISGTDIRLNTTTADFLANVTPAPGASLMILNSDGNETTSGTLLEGDVLKVTSGDGEAVAFYDIVINYVGIEPDHSAISVYPNPNTGKFQVSGVEIGSRIQVYNVNGARILDLQVTNSVESVSLEGHANGIYFLVINNNNGTLGRHKIIKK